MTSPRIARRYASALYAASERAGEVERVVGDLALVRATVQENPRLADALIRGSTADSAKKRIIQRLFGEAVSFVTLQFLFLLVDKRREDVIETIEAAYRKVVDERRRVQRAEVASAVELTREETERMREVLSRLTGRSVQVDTTVDPSLLGGIIIRIGDRLIDGSVRGQLVKIHDRIAGTAR